MKISGKQSEEMAISFLKNLGYQIVDRNWKYKRIGEIDIIAKKENVFNFIEVKSLREGNKFLPEYHLTYTKFNKIKRLAEFYVNQNGIKNWCISLLTIILFPEKKINFYENVQI
ncbi:MAG: YraN family protein [Patescibacteria group bacterium]|nr:YraN family protein [Patescibacteria group bacterium]